MIYKIICVVIKGNNINFYIMNSINIQINKLQL